MLALLEPQALPEPLEPQALRQLLRQVQRLRVRQDQVHRLPILVHQVRLFLTLLFHEAILEPQALRALRVLLQRLLPELQQREPLALLPQ